MTYVEHSADDVNATTSRRTAQSAGLFPAHDRNAPLFDGKDIAAFAVISAMMLGPLLAYASGFGA